MFPVNPVSSIFVARGIFGTDIGFIGGILRLLAGGTGGAEASFEQIIVCDFDGCKQVNDLSYIVSLEDNTGL